ncbi:MAG: SnoaL-like domain-containing protein [Rhodobacteraceae bacterium]|nr:SnoaL-like domain-containing protein [Paracoccaceae bacterium]
MGTQANKDQILAFWAALDAAEAAEIVSVCNKHLAPDFIWRGPAPLSLQTSPKAVADSFWHPLKQAIPDLKREIHMIFGGTSSGRVDGGQDGENWVCGTGYLTGQAEGEFLNIPTTQQRLRLRWGAFYKLRQGQIVESQMLIDFVDWFDQIGLPVLPKSLGISHVYPPPTAFDGVMAHPQDPAQTAETLHLGRQLLYGGLNLYDTAQLSSMGMAGFFHPNIKWYGPGGIGACFSLAEFETLHQRPWLAAFPDRKVQDLDALIAEGALLGAAGVAGVRATQSGAYLTAPASGKQLQISGLDFWLRQGDKFTENWVFVDMIDLFAQMGQDLFAQLQRRAQPD